MTRVGGGRAPARGEAEAGCGGWAGAAAGRCAVVSWCVRVPKEREGERERERETREVLAGRSRESRAFAVAQGRKKNTSYHSRVLPAACMLPMSVTVLPGGPE